MSGYLRGGAPRNLLTPRHALAAAVLAIAVVTLEHLRHDLTHVGGDVGHIARDTALAWPLAMTAIVAGAVVAARFVGAGAVRRAVLQAAVTSLALAALLLPGGLVHERLDSAPQEAAAHGSVVSHTGPTHALHEAARSVWTTFPLGAAMLLLPTQRRRRPVPAQAPRTRSRRTTRRATVCASVAALAVTATPGAAHGTPDEELRMESEGCRELILQRRVPVTNVQPLVPSWYRLDSDASGRVDLVLRLHHCQTQRLEGAVPVESSTATLGVGLQRACGSMRGTDVFTLFHTTDNRQAVNWLRRHTLAPQFSYADVLLAFEDLAAGAGRYTGGAAEPAPSPFSVQAVGTPTAVTFPLPLYVRWWAHVGDASVLVTNDLRQGQFRLGSGAGTVTPAPGSSMAAVMTGATDDKWITGTFDSQITSRHVVPDDENPYRVGTPTETATCQRAPIPPPGRSAV